MGDFNRYNQLWGGDDVPHNKESSATVGLGVCLPKVQVDKKTAEKRKPYEYSVGPY